MAETTIDSPTTTARLDVSELAHPGWAYSALIALLAFARVTVPGGANVMWSDDGVFLAKAIDETAWESISYPHHGYLNLTASLTATIVEAVVPLPLVALAFVAIWAAVVGALASWVALMSRSFVNSRWSQLLIGASVGLIPIAGFESIGSPANLQWSLLAAALFALVGEQQSRLESSLAWIVVGVAALSAPAALTFLPLIIWRRDRTPVVVAWGVGVTVQAVAVLSAFGERNAGGDWFAFDDIITTFAATSVNGISSGLFANVRVWTPISVGFVIIVALSVWRGWRPQQILVLVGSSALMWWFTYGGGGATPVVPRYMIVPAIVGLTVVLAASERHHITHVAVMIVVVLCWVGAAGASAYRTNGDGWRAQLNNAPCANGYQRVTLAPVDWGAIDVPC